MHRAYKYRLYPTVEQQQLLNEYFGSVRWVWNRMLEANMNEYQNTKKFIWSQQFQKQLPALKKQHEWLKTVPSQALQQKCDDLQQALKMASKKRAKRFGFPKFKSKHHNKQSFRIPQQANQIKIASSHIKVPKIGAIKWVYHRPVIGSVKTVTIKMHNDQYYITVVCEVPDATKELINKNTTVGIDLGLTTFAVLSDGSEIQTPKFYRKKQKKLKQAQQRLARKQKGSANRKKAVKELRKIHTQISNQRHDFIHQHSRRIANSYSGVYVEDLDIESIKQRFGKSTSDQGWAMFVHALSYKCNYLGKINRWAASTKTCSNCGAVHNLKLADRELTCHCGHVQSRDLNAARNIKFWGISSTPAELFMKNTSGTEEIDACGNDKDLEIARDVNKSSLSKQEKFLIDIKKPSVL